MKTYWNEQELDTSKEYKINTIASTEGKGNPWYDQGHSETKANNVFVRKWDDEDWHTPDVEYMGIEEDK